MVVQYREVRVTSPAIVGVFQANEDREIQKLLKMSEPALHNKWVPKHEEADPATAEDIRLLVTGIHRSIGDECRKLSNDLAPEQLDDQTRIEELNRHLSSLLSSGSGEVPDPADRDFSIRRHQPDLEVIDSRHVRASGRVDFRQLSESPRFARVAIRFFLPDDSNRRHDPISITLTTDGGIRSCVTGEGGEIDAYFETDGENSRFSVRWQTGPYSRLFVGDLDVEVIAVESMGGDDHGA